MSKRLKGSLGALASGWARRLTQLAKGYAPNHLKGGISSKSTETSNGRWEITVTARGADAKAQEFGSGLRATKGTKKKYPIRPKTKKFLAFYWEKATVSEMERGRPGVFRFLPDGRVAFGKVMHPGIKPYQGKGYIRPAMKELRKRAKKDLGAEVRKAIVGDLSSSFKTGRR